MAQIDTPLHQLATEIPGAARVLQRHGLDFCCGGRRTLAAASKERGLDPAAVLCEIESSRTADAVVPWNDLALPLVLDEIYERYHVAHRRDFPELIRLAEKVESRHAGKPGCPTGLAAHLTRMWELLQMHMLKEEQILFPLIRSERTAMLPGPIQVMELEHEEMAADLAATRELTGGLAAPDDACTSWRALYFDLERVERELLEHAGIENNVLFPRALGA